MINRTTDEMLEFLKGVDQKNIEIRNGAICLTNALSPTGKRYLIRHNGSPFSGKNLYDIFIDHIKYQSFFNDDIYSVYLQINHLLPLKMRLWYRKQYGKHVHLCINVNIEDLKNNLPEAVSINPFDIDARTEFYKGLFGSIRGWDRVDKQLEKIHTMYNIVENEVIRNNFGILGKAFILIVKRSGRPYHPRYNAIYHMANTLCQEKYCNSFANMCGYAYSKWDTRSWENSPDKILKKYNKHVCKYIYRNYDKRICKCISQDNKKHNSWRNLNQKRNMLEYKEN